MIVVNCTLQINMLGKHTVPFTMHLSEEHVFFGLGCYHLDHAPQAVMFDLSLKEYNKK